MDAGPVHRWTLPATAPAVLAVVRHAEPARGLPDGGLTGRGEAQAVAAGSWLRGVLAGFAGPAAVMTSPAARAMRTAELLRVGAPVPSVLLGPRDWGRWFDGAADPALRDAEARRCAAADPWGWAPDGGESLRDIAVRAERCLSDVLAANHAMVVLVTHAEWLQASRILRAAAHAECVVWSRRDPDGQGVHDRYRWRTAGPDSPGWVETG